eukprot:3284171-Alexandrium_andersonii.AAC.1
MPAYHSPQAEEPTQAQCRSAPLPRTGPAACKAAHIARRRAPAHREQGRGEGSRVQARCPQ